jgi:hypothetical protein
MTIEEQFDRRKRQLAAEWWFGERRWQFRVWALYMEMARR